ncbi:hypothetical protein HC723_05580 [Vibrio sp. S11_S32]|uniref:Uncharacterized protein n=1 Tax=Vibrio algicola TaxID=2662262 RepID=A0A5Q0TIE4_9VIBR|nr:hypothetical protein [Vibrio sp. S11_S32]
MQQARTPHSHQLVYRQVDIDQQFSAFVNTTNNNFMLFTFIKLMPCDTQMTYHAKLSVNKAAAKDVTLHCEDNQQLVFRIAPRNLHYLNLTNKDFAFKLDHQAWQIELLRKDDFMQHNYQFFQKHSDEKVYPWSRD